jgi:hypothetical protein
LNARRAVLAGWSMETWSGRRHQNPPCRKSGRSQRRLLRRLGRVSVLTPCDERHLRRLVLVVLVIVHREPAALGRREPERRRPATAVPTSAAQNLLIRLFRAGARGPCHRTEPCSPGTTWGHGAERTPHARRQGRGGMNSASEYDVSSTGSGFTPSSSRLSSQLPSRARRVGGRRRRPARFACR